MEQHEVDKFAGQRIREARKELNLKQEEFAQLLGSKQTTISGYETGYRALTIGLLYRIACILKKPISYFFPPVPVETAEGKGHEEIHDSQSSS